MIPVMYRPPLGLPLRWQDETSGELVAAVQAFFEQKRLSNRQFVLLRAYLIHYICAPCWDVGCDGDESGLEYLADLRKLANKLAHQEDIMGWINRCLGVGIDPL